MRREGGRAWPSYLSLFTSLGTLVCCALPALLVLLDLGATVASIVSAAPSIVSLSRHKELVFAVSSAVIAFNFFYLYRVAPAMQARALGCPVGDPRCRATGRFSRIIFWVSCTIWLAGFFVAFLLGPILWRINP